MSSKPPEKAVSKPDAGFSAPRGMEDIYGAEWLYWDKLFKVARKLSEFYDFLKIETPVLEEADLFINTAGEATELVEKELYTARSKTGEMLALRPEITVGVARAFLEHKLSRAGQLQKFWYEGPVFRYERLAPGRWREFHQLGFEIMGGVNDPLYDAQIVLVLWKLFESLKLKKVALTMNSVGCKICRPIYMRQLQNFYKNHEDALCEDCKRRFKVNPLRLLDCRNEHCRELAHQAPNFFDKLCSPCSHHFRSVLEYLDELKVPYALNNFLVHGFDYYARTVFELSIDGGGEELQLLACGGRYDYLFETLGTKSTPGVGGALHMERVIFAMKAQGVVPPPKPGKRVFIIHVGDLAKKKMLGIIETLREAGIQVSEALSKESLQAQLKMAGGEENKLALILGQKEVFEESIIIRDLKHATQETVPLTRLVDEIRKRIK